ncbi:hypothetical protein VTG60DRAFT_5521 [Thermothelomyces hinnuleus]
MFVRLWGLGVPGCSSATSRGATAPRFSALLLVPACFYRCDPEPLGIHKLRIRYGSKEGLPPRRSSFGVAAAHSSRTIAKCTPQLLSNSRTAPRWGRRASGASRLGNSGVTHSSETRALCRERARSAKTPRGRCNKVNQGDVLRRVALVRNHPPW